MTTEEKLEKAYKALRTISTLGGNLPDDRHETRTGPNDAVSRGIMYTSARKIANETLLSQGLSLPDMTYYKPR